MPWQTSFRLIQAQTEIGNPDGHGDFRKNYSFADSSESLILLNCLRVCSADWLQMASRRLCKALFGSLEPGGAYPGRGPSRASRIPRIVVPLPGRESR